MSAPSILTEAFPRELASEVTSVLEVLPPSATPPAAHDVGMITLGGQELRIPSRIYNPEPLPAVYERLNPTQQLILSALYTRHADGHIRENALRRIIASQEAWVAPFVVQLLGEYVLEILELIDTCLTDELKATYATFLRENPKFLQLTRQRMLSYWNCYYRDRFPRSHGYVGEKVLLRLEAWANELPTAAA